MTEYSLPYGKSNLTCKIPDSFMIDKHLPDPVQPPRDIETAISQALSHPLGKRKMSAFSGANSVGIAINDKTRPVPKPNPLTSLLHYLESNGIERESISLFVGSGTHTPMTQAELTHILDEEILSRYKVFVHDCDESPMIDLGTTAHHTPIHINEAFFNCELKISVGNIEPHHFMGFSGGVKTAVIGLASRETINANHAMLSHPQAKSGVFHINPMRQDIEEMGRKAGIHFSLGSILDEDKNNLDIFFGDPLSVMNAAIPVVKQIFGTTVSEPYDLVIASPGGHPKDINLYQAQKGLTHAARITRDGGWVILLAACPEGSGSQSYEAFVKHSESHQEIIDLFNNGFFEVGPHKAFQIAREAVRVNIVLVSDISPQTVKDWMLTPSRPDLLNQLIDWFAVRLPQDARIAVLPAATRTMAEVKK